MAGVEQAMKDMYVGVETKYDIFCPVGARPLPYAISIFFMLLKDIIKLFFVTYEPLFLVFRVAIYSSISYLSCAL